MPFCKIFMGRDDRRNDSYWSCEIIVCEKFVTLNKRLLIITYLWFRVEMVNGFFL